MTRGFDRENRVDYKQRTSLWSTVCILCVSIWKEQLEEEGNVYRCLELSGSRIYRRSILGIPLY